MTEIINFADHYFSFDFTGKSYSSPSQERKQKIFTPAKHGRFDNLSGIYSVINSVGHLGKLSNEECSDVFNQVIKIIGKSYNLSKILRYGASENQFLLALKIAMSCLTLKYNVRLQSAPLFNPDAEICIGYYFAVIENLLRSGDGIFIINIGGIHNHWTCVKSATEESFQLLDSCGIEQININECYIGEEQDSEKYHLDSNKVYHLWIRWRGE